MCKLADRLEGRDCVATSGPSELPDPQTWHSEHNLEMTGYLLFIVMVEWKILLGGELAQLHLEMTKPA